MTLFDSIIFKHPILRVNNRDMNIAFYEKSLGLKLVSEENSIAIFSAWDNAEASFMIEESPSRRTRAAEQRKLAKIIIKAKKASDVASLLAQGAEASRIFKGEKGYAYETISPEGDVFLLHAEDDINSLSLIDTLELDEYEAIKGLSDFSFETIILNVPDIKIAESFYNSVFQGNFPVEMAFVEAEGKDLTISPETTWDIEILDCQVPNDSNLSVIKDYLEDQGISAYLDTKERLLVFSDTSNIEIWIQKV